MGLWLFMFCELGLMMHGIITLDGYFVVSFAGVLTLHVWCLWFLGVFVLLRLYLELRILRAWGSRAVLLIMFAECLGSFCE